MALPFDSTLTLYHDIPFDPMYEHSVLFSSVAAQDSYFASRVVADNAKFKNLSYQRYERGTIRVQSKMSLLTNANYLKFYNNNRNAVYQDYEDVKFYCFITNITYVNENTVEISYEIDHFQTWMFYYQMNACYVEREHVASDDVGEHRIPEGMETGEYVMAGWEPIVPWESSTPANSAFVVIATQLPNGTPTKHFIDNTYSTLTVGYANGVTALDSIINLYLNGSTQSTEPIISISQFPSEFLNETQSGTIAITYTLQSDQTIGLGGFKSWNPNTEQYLTYIPLNNKLNAYPYNYMVLESPEGSSSILKYEDFKTFNTHQFQLGISVFPMVQMICNPIGYQSGTSVNIREGICSNMFPTVGVASPSFEAWWAQNKWFHPTTAAYVDGVITARTAAATGDNSTFWNSIKTTFKAIMSGFSAAGETARNPAILAQNAGAALGDLQSVMSIAKPHKGMLKELDDKLGSMTSSLVSDIGSDLAAIESHKAIPDTVATKASGNAILHKTQLDCFKIYYTQIRPENAKIIDDYLSAFGYSVHAFKVPNRTSRYYWNYVKTRGCTITPVGLNNNYLPMEAERAVCAIYDKGITIWHNPADFKNYMHTVQGETRMFNPIVT